MAPPNPIPILLTVGKVAVATWGAATVVNALVYKHFIARKDFAPLTDPYEDPGNPDAVLAQFAVDKPIASDGEFRTSEVSVIRSGAQSLRRAA